MAHNEFGPPSLIVCDIDGTLVGDDNLIGPMTRAALERAIAAGVTVLPATGRPPRWLAEIIDQLPPLPYAVCANGAVLYDISHDRILHSTTLDAPTLAWLADAAHQQLPGCGLAAERAGNSAHDAATAPFVATTDYRHAWLNPDHVELSEQDLISQPAVKMLVRCPGMPSAEMADRMLPLVGSVADLTYSTDNGLIELAAPGVSKAAGLRILAEIANLPTDSVIAFGDMPNDVAMLQWAGYGVAMGDAHPAAKAAAEEVTASVADDGVGRVLSRWF